MTNEPDWEIIAQELMKYHLRDELAPLEKLQPNPDNPKIHPEEQISKIANSLKRFGPVAPIIVDENYMIVAGHARYKAAKQLGLASFPVRVFSFDADTATMYMLADNKLAEDAEWDAVKLPELLRALESRELDLDVMGFAPLDLDKMRLQLRYDEQPRDHSALVRDFIVPPFSVLDTTRDYWQQRKDIWLALGVQDGSGRDTGLIGNEGGNPRANIYNSINTGTSYFDPVLAEIAYKWFCPPKGSILDPFAGGVIRGGVAGSLGHPYTGVDLSDTQIAANWDRWESISSNLNFFEGVETHTPAWHLGDAANITEVAPGEYDLVFSCPPYFDLETYTDKPEDLSNMAWPEFCLTYDSIIRKCVGQLKDNRFAVWVVGDVRDKNGFYRDLIGVTITAFVNAGAKLYNDIIIKTAIATAPVRARRYFKNRKVVNIHQRMLVFYKGEPKRIAEEFGEPDVGEFTQLEEVEGFSD